MAARASLYLWQQLVQLAAAGAAMPAVQQVSLLSLAGAPTEAMCESLRLMAGQPGPGRPLPACCLDMGKVFNNSSQPGHIKVVSGAQCQWLGLGHCTGAEHDGGAGAWQAV
ncbi:hypothetical protein V8C86DRAFT_2658412, partial [Haematococcus lacustris]